MKSLSAFSSLIATAGSALAHDGHGPNGSHWHATDAWGFAALALMVAVAVFFGRGGK
jgi:hypothetical protein